MIHTLYISQQGSSISLKQEQLVIKRDNVVQQQVQLPLIEQILVFGQSQVTTQALRACLKYKIPVLYLSRMGQCYGRLIPIQQGYRQLARRQAEIPDHARLRVAQAIVKAKLHNSRILLLRQARQRSVKSLVEAAQYLDELIQVINKADSQQALMGIEGAAAARYFSVIGDCIINPDFQFRGRNRRPPADPVNALLSFGYQLLWNHLYSLIESQNIDPYDACLHQGNRKHAALASDLLEAFRAPLSDSIMLYLVNHKVINCFTDFTFTTEGACYLNDQGRKKYLRLFIMRMEQKVKAGKEISHPRWDILMLQVKHYKQFVYDPSQSFQPYLIR